jgi:hypothetical protein
MRADEHEGVLNDSQEKRESDMMRARADEIQLHDLVYLAENDQFLRFFGGWAVPALTQEFPPGSGAALERFMGRRGLVLDMISRLDLVSPGVLQRMLEVRRLYEKDIRAAAQKGQNQ